LAWTAKDHLLEPIHASCPAQLIKIALFLNLGGGPTNICHR
jgi:hypothetical protein